MLLTDPTAQRNWITAITNEAKGWVFEVNQPVRLEAKGFGRKHAELKHHSMIGGEKVRISSAYCTSTGHLILTLAPTDPQTAIKVSTMTMPCDLAMTCLTPFEDFMDGIGQAHGYSTMGEPEPLPEGVNPEIAIVKSTKSEAAWGAW